MEREPLVSVIIPNYNHENFLKARIDSVLAQSFQDFELIILDDCSKDSSVKIIECYRKHPKVSKIIYSESNSGSTFKQWNKGVDNASGTFIWIAESDDLADEEFLEKVLKPLTDNIEVGLSFTQSYKMDHRGNVDGTWQNFMKSTNSKMFINDFVMKGDLFIEKSLIYKNTIPNASSLVFRKDIYKKIGGANTDLKYCADWLTWLKMATVSQVAYHSKPLNYFRYHDNSVIAKSKKSGEVFIKKYDIILRNLFSEYLMSSGVHIDLLECNEKQKRSEEKIEHFVKLKTEKRYFLLLVYFIKNCFDKTFTAELYGIFIVTLKNKFFNK